MARSFFALTALACLVPAGRGPCNARITHRSGDIAATAAAAAAAQSAADAAQADATDAQGMVGTLADSIGSTGVAMAYGPASKTGSGSADSQTLTVPSAISLIDGKQYEVEGTLVARKGDGTVLMTKKIEGVRFLRASGSFSLIAEGDERLTSAAHADIATYFTAENRRPSLGFSGANLTLDWQAESGQSFNLEFDGSIANVGTAPV